MPWFVLWQITIGLGSCFMNWPGQWSLLARSSGGVENAGCAMQDPLCLQAEAECSGCAETDPEPRGGDYPAARVLPVSVSLMITTSSFLD